MSDRLAVFNLGKIEQIGAPATVYERPATRFVAGFVGTTNLIEGALAQWLTGQATRFALRPEKIHLGPAAAPLLDDAYCLDGVVKEVVYLGLYTRYVVTLDSGDDLIVVQQNLVTGSTTAAVRGARVRVQWLRQHLLALGA
jgi:putative spermidine/putrescine transport system ATP-binding protein